MSEAVSRLVLASSSATRAAMLSAAGLLFDQEAPNVDEGEVKHALLAERASSSQAAQALAELKARRVSRRHAGAFVIGADQILECEGRWYDKPSDLDGARGALKSLRGRSHVLATSVCVLRDGQTLWHHTDRPRLMMRAFSDGFLDWYLGEVGDSVRETVGGYRLEGVGAQLFTKVEGDFFSILGMPLLPLLDFLRSNGLVGR